MISSSHACQNWGAYLNWWTLNYWIENKLFRASNFFHIFWQLKLVFLYGRLSCILFAQNLVTQLWIFSGIPVFDSLKCYQPWFFSSSWFHFWFGTSWYGTRSSYPIYAALGQTSDWNLSILQGSGRPISFLVSMRSLKYDFFI